MSELYNRQQSKRQARERERGKSWDCIGRDSADDDDDDDDDDERGVKEREGGGG